MTVTRKLRKAKPMKCKERVQNQNSGDSSQEIVGALAVQTEEEEEDNKYTRSTRPAIPILMGLKKVKPSRK